MTDGICRTAGCSNAVSGTRVERYPGPGEYCPECGEALEPVTAPAAPPTPPPPTRPFGGLTALQALQQLDVANASPEPAPARPRGSRLPQRIAIASVAVAVAAVGAVTLLRPIAMGRPSAADVVRVCRSTMTQRLGADVISEYARASGTPNARFDMAGAGGCDVRFTVIPGPGRDVLGRDGIVAIVNPQNKLRRLSRHQIRGIFTGAITDWSQVGGPRGRITPLLTQERSDEARALSNSLLPATDVAPGLRRLGTSADVVHAVVSGKGRGAIGLVAFSAAVPAKVITFGSLPPPSTLSIGDARYPLTVAVIVELLGTNRPAADGLVRFARSDAAQTIVVRDGFVPKKGL